MRKVYGQSRISNCPFCDSNALVKNSQGVPVCMKHRSKNLEGMKCACGEWLDLREGKWGPFFTCINCGSINFGKAMELNPQVKIQKKQEITVRSDEVDFI